MKKALLLSLLLLSAYGCKREPSIDGKWHGAIAIAGKDIPLDLNVKKESDGSYSGTMDSPEQKSMGLKIDQITLKDKAVKLGLAKLGGTYDGLLSDDGNTIVGNWSQGGFSLKLDLKKAADAK